MPDGMLFAPARVSLLVQLSTFSSDNYYSLLRFIWPSAISTLPMDLRASQLVLAVSPNGCFAAVIIDKFDQVILFSAALVWQNCAIFA